jgi:hypothetical protein
LQQENQGMRQEKIKVWAVIVQSMHAKRGASRYLFRLLSIRLIHD